MKHIKDKNGITLFENLIIRKVSSSLKGMILKARFCVMGLNNQ